MSEQTTLTPYESAEDLPAIGTELSQAIVFDEQVFNRVERLAEVMASGKSTMPAHLKGNSGDCMAIVIQAMTWGMNPWAVAQKTHTVHGTLGYEAQLVNAVINTMAPTKDRIHYEWFGEWDKILGKFKKQSGPNGDYTVPNWNGDDEVGLGVRVWATLKGEDEPRELQLLLKQAVVRNSTLWAQDPRQQLAYLAVKRWSRLYCPDVILGVYSPDELDQSAPIRDVTPQSDPGSNRPSAVDKLKMKVKAGSITDKDQAEDVQTKSEIINSLKAAKSEAEMIQIVRNVTKLGSKDQDEIRTVYAQILRQIKQGQVTPGLIKNKIEAATGLDELALAGDLINMVAVDERAALVDVLQAKQNEIVATFDLG